MRIAFSENLYREQEEFVHYQVGEPIVNGFPGETSEDQIQKDVFWKQGLKTGASTQTDK